MLFPFNCNLDEQAFTTDGDRESERKREREISNIRRRCTNYYNHDFNYFSF